MQVFINSETAPLKAVLLGFMDNFKLKKPVNSVQEYYYRHDPPQIALMVEQYQRLIQVLEARGVTVFRYDHKPDNLDRPFARDAQAVIGDKLFLCAMKNRPGPDISDLLANIESPVVNLGASHTGQPIMEGGDVIIDRNIVYIGLGQRTDTAGVQRLKAELGTSMEVQPLRLKNNVLHLDVVLNPLGKNLALVYPPAFEEDSLSILTQRWRLFAVTPEEQFALGVNVLSLTPETVITEQRSVRINDFLQKEGFETITVDYSEVIKLGGSFRCSTCPLIRDKL